MARESDPLAVLRAYPEEYQPGTIRALGSAGGFSGAQFWRIEARAGALCLRRWPKDSPSREGLEFIQAVLWHATKEGFDRLPLPIETRLHRGYVPHGGFLWELGPWIPGRADYREDPSFVRLRAALTTLGQFHQATATFPLPDSPSSRSPGICARLARLRRWLEGDLDRLAAMIRPGVFDAIHQPARRLVSLVRIGAGGVRRLLEHAVGTRGRLQPCIGDVWSDHVLFQGNRVSGIIDFGSMRAESVAADVARLLGSMAGDDGARWRAGLEAYQTVRPLSEAELLLIHAFDQSTVLLAGLNWIDWIYRQGRVFENRDAIPARLDEILQRLARLCEH